jgi:hypothetical protein
MTLTCTLPLILYGSGSPLFIVNSTTATAGAPAMKIFSGVLLVLHFADLALTAATGHHICLETAMFKHISHHITE